MKKLIPQSIKNIYHLAQAVLANFVYGFPGRNIKVIGVTGTNGKTTTAQMIARILEEAGRKVAMASTINFKIREKEWVNKSKFTTLSSFQVQKFILDAVKAGCEYLVLETSSHSLDQYRVWGIKFDTAVITNVTREHLDYHQTMDEYRRAKLKLFRKAKTVVVNLDMERSEDFLRFRNERKIAYTCHPERIPSVATDGRSRRISGFLDNLPAEQVGLGMTVIGAENIEEGINYTKYQILNTKFLLNLPGRFNVENALAAACVGIAEGINLETIAQALEKIKGIPGRVEYVPNNKGLNIIVDYAVTPDSLEKLYKLILRLKEVRPLSTEATQRGRTSIIAVFGACGERDRGKRPIMGEIVSRYANFIILTNEDPYHEEPIGIINEIFSGITKKSEIQNLKSKIEGVNIWRILDRREAIKKALQIAKPGDYVIVTGKGAEETMAVGNERLPWNDKKVIMEILNSEIMSS